MVFVLNVDSMGLILHTATGFVCDLGKIVQTQILNGTWMHCVCRAEVIWPSLNFECFCLMNYLQTPSYKQNTSYQVIHYLWVSAVSLDIIYSLLAMDDV